MRCPLIVLVALCATRPTVPAESPSSPWLESVRVFADQVLAHGRDTYGRKHTPYFVDGINIDTGEPVEWVYGGAWEDLPKRKRNKFDLFTVQEPGDRWMLSDLANQQTLFRTFDGLSTLAGDPKYRQAAMDAIGHAHRHHQSRSGALYWGAHIAYDARADKTVLEQHRHELKFHLPHYPLMIETGKKSALECIEAMWDVHILDWRTLDMDRHGDFLTRKPARSPWSHRYDPKPPPFPGKGLSFCGTGCDLILAAIEHHRASGQAAPLVWARRLATRYTDGRHPKTGLAGYQFTEPADDRAREQFGGGRTEASILTPDMLRFRCARMPVCWFYFAEMLEGDDAAFFNREALRDLRAFARHCYDPGSNRVHGVFTDGTRIAPGAADGYYSDADGGRGGLRPVAAEPVYFRAFAMAWRVTGGRDAEIRATTRALARNFKLAEIGDSLADTTLPPHIKASDPQFLYGALDLHRASGNPIFLTLAKTIAANIFAQRMQNGYFTPRPDYVNTRFDCDEPLALLHLHAALHASRAALPTPWPSTPYFRCNFQGEGRGNDTQLIYGQRRSRRPPSP